MPATYGMLIAVDDAERERLESASRQDFAARVLGAASEHERTLHLETSWAAVDFVLRGERDERDAALDFLRPNVAQLGHAMGPDLGHGPARYLTPLELRTIASALERLHDQDIDRRIASPLLSEIAPFCDVDDETELVALAEKTLAEASDDREPTTADELVGRIKPRRAARPTARERADVREAIDELRAFVGKLVRDGAGALVVIA